MTEAAHAWAAQLLGTPSSRCSARRSGAVVGAARAQLVRIREHSAHQHALHPLVFIVIRLLVPRTWLAAAIGLALITAVSNNATAVSGGWFEFVFVFTVIAACTAVLFRHGLLAIAIALFVDNVVTGIPMTPHPSLWWAGGSNLTVLLLSAIAVFGFYASRAGQPLFGAILTRD